MPVEFLVEETDFAREASDEGLRVEVDLDKLDSKPKLKAAIFPDYWRPLSKRLVTGHSFDPLRLAVVSKPASFPEMEAKSASRIKLGKGATEFLHELRHFYDMVGTTYGFHTLLRIWTDVGDFLEMWTDLTRLGSIQLPLAEWSELPSAPAPLVSFMQKHKDATEWFWIGYGLRSHFFLSGERNEGPTCITFSSRGKTGQFSIPALPVAVHHILRNERLTWLMPIGMEVICEGAAFGTQYPAVFASLGTSANETIIDSWPRVPYRIVLELASKIWAAPIRYQTICALCDIALMGTRQRPHDFHPGWRLFRTLATIAKLGLDQPTSENFEEFADRICLHNKWPSLRETAQQALSLREAPFPAFPSLIEKTFQTIVAYHTRFMELRLQSPGLFVDLASSRDCFGDLPKPVLIVDGDVADGSVRSSSDLDREATEAWYGWYTLVDLIAQLLHKPYVTCPAVTLEQLCSKKDVGCKHLPYHGVSELNCFYKHKLKEFGLLDARLRPLR